MRCVAYPQYHPGAHFLILANGGPLEVHSPILECAYSDSSIPQPWWALYHVHKKESVYAILEAHRIGYLAEKDRTSYEECGNPFEDEPIRDKELHVYMPVPMDAATPKHILLENKYTPNELFYIRNHFPAPDIEAQDHEVCITIPIELCRDGIEATDTAEKTVMGKGEYVRDYGYEGQVVSQSFTLADLASSFSQATVKAVMYCTGFREEEVGSDDMIDYNFTAMSAGKDHITKEDYITQHGGGLAWEKHFERMDVNGDGQIDAKEYHAGRHSLQVGNATWRGTRLRHVLLKMGLDDSKVFETDSEGRFKKQWYVQLTGADGFSLSVPLEVCVRYDRDVLLATEMNGVPIPRDHGHPLRVLIPGYAGARSVKWIEDISITDDESTAPWHTRMYRLFGSDRNNLINVPMVQDKDALWASPACLEVTSSFLSPLLILSSRKAPLIC